jgi:hypothetical protein
MVYLSGPKIFRQKSDFLVCQVPNRVRTPVRTGPKAALRSIGTVHLFLSLRNGFVGLISTLWSRFSTAQSIKNT